MSFGSDPRRQRPRFAIRLAPILMGIVAIGMYAMQNCQQGPFGRHQVVALKPDQEAQLGFQAFQEVLQDAKVVRQGQDVETVREVARRLTAAANSPHFLQLTKQKEQQFDWRVEVVDSPEINAFCLPGGKIVVYTGILPVAESAAGLATVMGHEIAHALAHHGAERMAKQQILNIGMNAANGSLGDMSPEARNSLLSVLNAGAKYGSLKYDRSHESEADHMGLLLMAAAGFNPEESVHFWERMKQRTQGQQHPPEFASTHPSHETRIADLASLIPEAMPLYEANRSK